MEVVINETDWEADSEKRGLGGRCLKAKSVTTILKDKKLLGMQVWLN